MSFSFQQVPWMPSPPLVPGQYAIDVTYLRRMTLGDAALEREVLEMFKDQTSVLIGQLAGMPTNSSELAHTLKGSARAIGAFDLGEAASALEKVLLNNSGYAAAFQRLKLAVDETFEAIGAVLDEHN
ncbi:MAG: Hpt domain-containing protein [Xanthobacteraceae bacterium]|nr:Hpt domain-containing protein [Xanthobacteraceae bacterium]